MEKGALIVASYGSTHAAARSRGVDLIARDLAEAFPRRKVVISFTSSKVRRALEQRGEHEPSVEEACAALVDRGFDDIVVLPALVTSGETLDAVVNACAFFASTHTAAPLLASKEDARALARILSERHPRNRGEALVLVGHGSGLRADEAFASLQDELEGIGRDDMLVSTLSAAGGPEALVERFSEHAHTVRLVPLLLSAGSHVQGDLLGAQDESWASRFASCGFTVAGVCEGLAEIASVRKLFVEHTRSCI